MAGLPEFRPHASCFPHRAIFCCLFWYFRNHTVVGTFWAGTDDAKVLVILTKNTDMQQDPEQNSKLHRRSAEHVRKHVEGAANDFEKPDKQVRGWRQMAWVLFLYR